MEKFTYRLSDRQRELTSEVICQRHLAECERPGGCMAPLSQNEKARGLEQRVLPYSGERECAMCLEERGEQQGAA